MISLEPLRPAGVASQATIQSALARAMQSEASGTQVAWDATSGDFFFAETKRLPGSGGQETHAQIWLKYVLNSRTSGVIEPIPFWGESLVFRKDFWAEGVARSQLEPWLWAEVQGRGRPTRKRQVWVGQISFKYHFRIAPFLTCLKRVMF